MNRRKGSLMIMVMLMLFVALLFIIAAVWSVICLNNLQKNENEIIKENISVSSLISDFNQTAMYGDKKANLRGPLEIILNGELSSGNVSFDYLHTNALDRKYLILDAKINNSEGRVPIHKKAFKPVPTFTYSHFVINPEENLGDLNVREECSGIVRANRISNTFVNVNGSAIKDSGKPYIYMQDINFEDYINLSKNYELYIDTSYLNFDTTLYFYRDNHIMVSPSNMFYTIDENCVITVKNNGYKVRLVGVNEDGNRYTNIEPDFNITLVTDSPIFIESDIYSENYSFIMISNFKDTKDTAAFNVDINKYIDHKLMPNGSIDGASLYFGVADGIVLENEINTVYLKSIFIATNGSFGIQEKTYYKEGYNTDTVNRYNIIGGIIEYNSNYMLKNFEDVPLPYPHLLCQRDESFLSIGASDEFPFIAPPLAKNIFSFSSNYFGAGL